MAFREKMERYKAGMEFNLYAAEQACQNGDCKDGCPWDMSGLFQCKLHFLRDLLGDHVIQHDCMVPPCQCAGDTGEGTVRE